MLAIWAVSLNRAGDLAGLARHLADDAQAPATTTSELEHAPKGTSIRWVMTAITLAILVGLFLFQRRGTASVGALFGPVMLIWFAVLAIFGGIAIALRKSSYPPSRM